MARGRDQFGQFYLEMDNVDIGADVYLFRATLVGNGRNPNGTRTIHIDFRRQSDGLARRYENIELETRQGGETHRACLRRQLQPLRGSGTSIPSPVL